METGGPGGPDGDRGAISPGTASAVFDGQRSRESPAPSLESDARMSRRLPGRRTSSLSSITTYDRRSGPAASSTSDEAKAAEVTAASPWLAGCSGAINVNILIRVVVFALILASAGLGTWFYVVNGPDQETALFMSAFGAIVQRLSVVLPAALDLQNAATGLVEGAFIFRDACGNATLPSFESFYYLASNLAVTTNSLAVGFAPQVTAAGRSDFEASMLGAYAPIYVGDSIMGTNARLGIWEAPPNATWGRTSATVVPQSYAGTRPVYYPLTYVAPTVNNQRSFLWDIYSDPVRKAAIDNTLRYGGGAGGAYTTDMLYFSGRPGAAAVRPVYSPYRDLLGLAYVQFLWEDLLADGGLASLVGVDLAIQAPSGAAFSFRLNGAYPAALGSGSHCDPGMGQYAQTVSASVGLTWRFTICPTADYHGSFFPATNRDVIIIIIAATAAVCALFVAYDTLAARQAKRLTRVVAATTRLLDDVFPTTVKHRLVKDMEDGAASVGGASGVIAGLDSSLPRAADGGIIADFYPESTILFSDIVNFTVFSSTQTPTQIFTVLETLFGAFDAAAAANGVFKVETIGDAYVCAAGVPWPSEWHAAQIADMALAMLDAMPGVRESTGVPDLQVRIGINSGPITAGVIRAQNRRFQLFGDTMNTASRMESNSSPGRVHVSEATFFALTALGTHALSPRGDVDIKGKGVMRTYWLDGVAEGRAPADGSAPESPPPPCPPRHHPPIPPRLPPPPATHATGQRRLGGLLFRGLPPPKRPSP